MMYSKFEIFNRVRRLWPLLFTIEHPKSSGDLVVTRPSLWDTYQNIDNDLAPDGELIKLANWAIYQSLHALGMSKVQNKVEHLYLKDVTFQSFDFMIRTNLADESWRDELYVYESLPES